MDEFVSVVVSIVDVGEGVQCLFAEGEGIFYFFVFGLGDDGGIEQEDVVNFEQSVSDLHETLLLQIDLHNLLETLELILLQQLTLLIKVYVKWALLMFGSSMSYNFLLSSDFVSKKMTLKGFLSEAICPACSKACRVARDCSMWVYR